MSLSKNEAVGVYFSLASAFLLVVALVPGLPYVYFTFLRIAVCLSAVMVAIWAAEHKVPWLLCIHVAIAILFNPLVKVHLKRDTWRAIDVATAAAMLCTAWRLKK